MVFACFYNGNMIKFIKYSHVSGKVTMGLCLRGNILYGYVWSIRKGSYVQFTLVYMPIMRWINLGSLTLITYVFC